MTDLFSPLTLGPLSLPHRIVMAPMTRSRAIGGTPNELMASYYRQRASAGLIITEGTAPHPDALGYPRIPGIFDPVQVDGWRQITEAVHADGGRIVVQLMHTGRIGHPANLPEGARLLAPSALTAEGMMYTDTEGPRPHPEPHAMTLEEVKEAQRSFVRAAQLARDAGFDGVELHGANGYLIEQFISPHTNRRNDAYGGDRAGRLRFAIETAREVAGAIGPDRVGIRLSPHNTFNDMRDFQDAEASYIQLAKAFDDLGLLYLHLVQTPSAAAASTIAAVRGAYGGHVILNGGFDRKRADEAIASGQADLVSFGRAFIANPDLVQRLSEGSRLQAPDANTFYTPGPEGYTDYAA